MSTLVQGAGYVGDYKEDETLYFMWETYDAAGASITRSTDGTFEIYKDGNTTGSSAGVTDTENFDGVTGVHLCTVVLTDPFYVVGSDYQVVVKSMVVDTNTLSSVVGSFSIVNRNDHIAAIETAMTSGGGKLNDLDRDVGDILNKTNTQDPRIKNIQKATTGKT